MEPVGSRVRPAAPKWREGCAGFRVKGVKVVAGTDEEAGGILGVAGPVDEAAAGGGILKAIGFRIVGERAAPEFTTRGGVEGNEGAAGSWGVEDAFDDDGRALDVGRAVAGAKRPREGEVFDVLAGDLGECGVAAGSVVALGARPGFEIGEVGRGGRKRGRRGGRYKLKLGECGAGHGIFERNDGSGDRQRRQSEEEG